MAEEKIEIRTPFIRLDQLLKFCGLAQTGGHAKEMILDGVVFVNGEKCLQRGKKLVVGDSVTMEDTSVRIVSKDGAT